MFIKDTFQLRQTIFLTNFVPKDCASLLVTNYLKIVFFCHLGLDNFDFSFPSKSPKDCNWHTNPIAHGLFPPQEPWQGGIPFQPP